MLIRINRVYSYSGYFQTINTVTVRSSIKDVIERFRYESFIGVLGTLDDLSRVSREMLLHFDGVKVYLDTSSKILAHRIHKDNLTAEGIVFKILNEDS